MTIAPAPPQLALVERKYATVRRALVVEAGVLVTIGVWLTVLGLVADVTFGGLNGLLAVALALGPTPAVLRRGDRGEQHHVRIAVGVRGLLTPFMHPFCTMFTGVGLGLVVSRRGAVRWIVPLAGYCLAASMHALWNSDIDPYLYPVLFVQGFVIVSVLLVRQRTHQRRLLERFIAPGPSTGLIDLPVFERLRSGGGSLRVALASMRTSDHPLHAWRELHHAAYTLAMYRDNVVRRLHDGSPPTADGAETEARLRETVGAAARRARHLVDCAA